MEKLLRAFERRVKEAWTSEENEKTAVMSLVGEGDETRSIGNQSTYLGNPEF